MTRKSQPSVKLIADSCIIIGPTDDGANAMGIVTSSVEVYDENVINPDAGIDSIQRVLKSKNDRFQSLAIEYQCITMNTYIHALRTVKHKCHHGRLSQALLYEYTVTILYVYKYSIRFSRVYNPALMKSIRLMGYPKSSCCMTKKCFEPHKCIYPS